MSSKYLYALLIGLLTVVSIRSNFLEEGPLTREAHDEIDQLFEKIFFESISPITELLFNKDKGEQTCVYCKGIIATLRDYVVEKHGFQGLYQFLTKICTTIGMDEDVCQNAIDGYAPLIFKGLINKMVDETHICALLKLCKEGNKYLNPDDFAKELLKDKPDKKREPIDAKAKQWRMLQVTDLHYDLYYQEGAAATCNKPMCCRDPPAPGVSTPLAGKYGYVGDCDINEALFRTFLDAAEESKPDFIIWTGDNAPHDVWKGSQEHVYNSTRILRDMLNEKFQHKIPIYPVLGNHEKYPNDAYGKDEHELLQGMADLYKEYLDDAAYEEFRLHGYYTMKHPNSNLRIVALNCMECDTWNFNLISDQSGSKVMFKWLIDVLRQAEKDGEYVYLLNHIPMNANFYLTECAVRLRAVIDRFNYIIRGHFTGHTHVDDIVGVHSYFNASEIIDINYVAPPLTTYSNHLPSFRVYQIDSSTKHIIDYEQYRFNVTEANIKGGAKWYISHKATELYQVKDLQEMKKMTEINPEGEYIIKHYAEGPGAVEASTKKKTIKRMKCGILNDNYNDFMTCMFNGKFALDKAWLYQVLNNLVGPWKDDGKN